MDGPSRFPSYYPNTVDLNMSDHVIPILYAAPILPVCRAHGSFFVQEAMLLGNMVYKAASVTQTF